MSKQPSRQTRYLCKISRHHADYLDTYSAKQLGKSPDT